MTERAAWTADDIGDLTGRVALVTGANSGLGYETASALAEHGAHVVMACRDEEKARRAYDDLDNDLERSSLEVLPLDLADLVSVHRAAEAFLATHARLDILVNNAGVMGTPYRLTADGFELQMATNHLGHFALTGLLLDRIVTTEQSRIVTVSSNMHRMGRLHLEDLAGNAARNSWVTYGATKLANLLFVAELARRLDAAGLRTWAVAAHPGWARSNLAGSGAALGESRVRRKLGRMAGATLGQSAAAGARPILAPPLHRPSRWGSTSGRAGSRRALRPAPGGPPVARARDAGAAARLFTQSEELTGVRYSVGAPV